MPAAVGRSSVHQLHPRVAIAQVGSWWTFDAPSLRVPSEDGTYVSIWSVGDGPSVLFVTTRGGHNFWVPAFSELIDAFTVHAVDLSLERALTEKGDARAADILVAAEAIGARAIVVCGPADQAEQAARRSRERLPVIDVSDEPESDAGRATPELGARIRDRLVAALDPAGESA